MAKSSAKSRIVFLCRECGSTHPKWAGRCPDCGGWDSLERFREPESSEHETSLLASEETEDAGGATRDRGARPIAEVEVEGVARLATGVPELDRVLGGGVVPGSAILLGGDPGVGKSTLLLQALSEIAATGRVVLYASSEESAAQVRLRAERLGRAGSPGLLVLAEGALPRILEQVRRHRPAVVVVDSIQMVHRPDLPAAPGSATQLRRCGHDLVSLAKRTESVVVVVGHVTKDGQLAGPKLLEHLVDVVLSFEGDRHHAHRVIRATKNRFGSTAEVGLLEMGARGLAEPAGGTLAIESGAGSRPGSVLFPLVAGSRGLLAEIQALTASAIPGAARRRASGLEANRLAVAIAILEKHGGLRLADRDVFAAATGGLKISEPASDLAMVLAIAGAHYGRAIGAGIAAFGEVGLTGEVRAVTNAGLRVAEAIRRGASRVIVPAAQKDLAGLDGAIDRVATLGEAIERLDVLTGSERGSRRRAGTPG